MSRNIYFLGLEDTIIPPKIGTLVWYFFGLLTRVTLIFHPGITILVLASPHGPELVKGNLLIELLLQLLCLLVGIWFNFKYFMVPNTFSLIPDSFITTSSSATFKMLSDYVFTLLVLENILSLNRIIFNNVVYSYNFVDLLISHTIIAVWTCDKFTNRLYKESFTDVREEISNLPAVGRAGEKLQMKLSDSERKEIVTLLYQEDQLNKVTVSGLYRFIWLCVVLSLIFNVAQEIIKRIFI